MKTLVIVLILSLGPNSQASQSSCTANSSSEQRLSKIEAQLSELSTLHDALKLGLRGDGIHRTWMDGMRSLGVKQATFQIRFVWSDGLITRLEVVSEIYSREYEKADTAITNPDELEQLRESGLASELREFALAKAKELLAKEDLGKAGYRRAFGTFYINLFDDECLPNVDHPAQICDGDETPLMRRMLRGESNAELYGVDAPACKDPKDPDSEKRNPKDLIASGVDVNAKDHSGKTALILAATESAEFVRILLDAGAHVNDRDRDGSTALAEAAKFGQMEAVRLLLNHGAEVNGRDRFGDTPLIQAAMSHGDSAAVIKVLYEAGADLNAKNDNGETALMQATRLGRINAVEALLNLGAEPNIRSNNGETALSIATSEGQAQIVLLLRRKGGH